MAAAVSVLPIDDVRALTFDCFGTLIDWEAGIIGALRPTLEAHGVRISDAELLACYAEAEAELERGAFLPYRHILEGVERRVLSELGLSGVPSRGLVDSLAVWPPFVDTRSSLARLATRYRLVICSNVDQQQFFPSVAESLGHRPDAPLFAHVITVDQTRSYKPAPGHFRAALTALELPPSGVLHVAQSRYHDIAPARALGMATCWINRRSARPGQGVAPAHPARSDPDLEFPTLAALADHLGV